ncbi:unnamed protein product, partial [Strongylus vulgaris]
MKERFRRSPDSIDKRFCFDLIVDERPDALTFQAVSEEECRQWIGAMDIKQTIEQPYVEPIFEDLIKLEAGTSSGTSKTLSTAAAKNLRDPYIEANNRDISGIESPTATSEVHKKENLCSSKMKFEVLKLSEELPATALEAAMVKNLRVPYVETKTGDMSGVESTAATSEAPSVPKKEKVCSSKTKDEVLKLSEELPAIALEAAIKSGISDSKMKNGSSIEPSIATLE